MVGLGWKCYLYIKTDRDGFHSFKRSFSADESNRGWRGKHRLPPPSHMAIVSYNACIYFTQWHITESHQCQILNKKNSPILHLLVRAVLQFSCVLLLVFFFLLLFICLVSISTLAVLSFSVLFCLVLPFFFLFFSSLCIWGISVTLRSLGGMSGMFWFNTSLPELSFDKSINICGF